MRDAPVSAGAVMMTGRGRTGRPAVGKYREHWGVRNHYGWWLIRACTARRYVDSNPTSYAGWVRMTARYGHRRSGLTAFWVRRGGSRVMVRANRYALAAALAGKPLEPWVRALQQFGVCAGEPGVRRRTSACVAGNAAREHVDDGTGRPRRRPGGYPPGRQWREGAESARGSVARGGPQRLGLDGGGGRTTGIARSDFVVRRAWRAVAGPRACGGRDFGAESGGREPDRTEP